MFDGMSTLAAAFGKVELEAMVCEVYIGRSGDENEDPILNKVITYLWYHTLCCWGRQGRLL